MVSVDIKHHVYFYCFNIYFQQTIGDTVKAMYILVCLDQVSISVMISL